MPQCRPGTALGSLDNTQHARSGNPDDFRPRDRGQSRGGGPLSRRSGAAGRGARPRCRRTSPSWARTAATSAPSPSLTAPDASRTSFADTARRLKIWIVGGTVPLRQDADGRVSASCLVYDPTGPARGALRQDAPVRRGRARQHRSRIDESAHTVPGHDARAWWKRRSASSGLAVCYDMRFPELFRVMSRQGADDVRGAVGLHRAHGQGALGSRCCAPAPSRTSAA